MAERLVTIQVSTKACHSRVVTVARETAQKNHAHKHIAFVTSCFVFDFVSDTESVTVKSLSDTVTDSDTVTVTDTDSVSDIEIDTVTDGDTDCLTLFYYTRGKGMKAERN